MDTNIRTTSYTLDDNDCVASEKGTRTARTVKIDMAGGFVAATHYPNGVLPKGTVLAKRTADGLYVAYNDGGTGGAAVAVGVLLASIRVANIGQAVTTKVFGALLWEGVLKVASMPFAAGVGGLDAAAQVDLAARFLFV